jgi:hypothetical protein
MLNRPETRIFAFWLLLTLCMMLHFDYHVSDIFYGIDVKRPNANGTKPLSLVAIRFVFQILPMLLAVAMLYFQATWFRKLVFGISTLYTLANAAHLAGELTEGEPSQLVLLSFTLLLSVLLNVSAWEWKKTPTTP